MSISAPMSPTTVPLFAQAGRRQARLHRRGSRLASRAGDRGPGGVAAEDRGADLKGKKVAVHQGRRQPLPAARRAEQAGLHLQGHPAGLSAACGWPNRLCRRQCRCLGGMGPGSSPEAQRQSNARVLADGSNGLASYKRYYLSSAAYADKRGDVLNVILRSSMKPANGPRPSRRKPPSSSQASWGIDAATVEEANSHRSDKVGAAHQSRPVRAADHRRRLLQRKAHPREGRCQRREDLGAEIIPF